MKTLSEQIGAAKDSLTPEQYARMLDEWRNVASVKCQACGGGSQNPVHRWHYRGCPKATA